MKSRSSGERPEAEKLNVFQACRSALLGSALYSCLINLLMFTGPLFMLQVYDRVLSSRSVPTLMALVVLVVALYVFMGCLELVRSRIMVRVGRRIPQRLSATVFDRIITLGLKHGKSYGMRPLQDLDTLRQFLSGPGPHALFDMPWVPIYLGVVFLLHPWLGLLALSGAILLFALALLNAHSTRTLAQSAARNTSAADALADETSRNAEVVRAMGMMTALRARWQSTASDAGVDLDVSSDRSGAITAASKIARLLLQSLMLALGAYLAIGDEISPGVMIAASIIMGRALAPVEQSIAHWRGFVSFRQAVRRLQLVFEKTSGLPARMRLPAPQGFIDVEKALIMAPGSTSPILQGVSFSLRPGESLGIIGPSGAGKSTLARALVGAWPIAAGSIRIDGAPLDQWDVQEIGSAIGYLPQNVQLFAGTVAENVSRFSPRATPENIICAAWSASAHDLILNLPQGYKTRLGEGGATLSAGQRQRIGLARALYGDPAIVVLDEPNAHLDSDGDAALAAAMKALRLRGTTVAIVSHRRTAVENVDYILLLENGRQKAFANRPKILGERPNPHTPQVSKRPVGPCLSANPSARGGRTLVIDRARTAGT